VSFCPDRRWDIIGVIGFNKVSQKFDHFLNLLYEVMLEAAPRHSLAPVSAMPQRVPLFAATRRKIVTVNLNFDFLVLHLEIVA
jgi:hypothetical protein